MSLRIKIQREIMLALIDEGYSQEEITNELNDLADEEIQRLDNEREYLEAKEQRQLQ